MAQPPAVFGLCIRGHCNDDSHCYQDHDWANLLCRLQHAHVHNQVTTWDDSDPWLPLAVNVNVAVQA